VSVATTLGGCRVVDTGQWGGMSVPLTGVVLAQPRDCVGRFSVSDSGLPGALIGSVEVG
jgi:hypothetical protein